MKKNVNDICLGDIRLERRNSMLYFYMYYDYPGEGSVDAIGIGIQPGHSFNNRLSHSGYWNMKKDEWFIKDFINSSDAKKLRIAYNEYKKDVTSLYKLYKSSLSIKETIPIYYIDDMHLNIELKEGDILVKKEENKLEFIELHDTDYYKNKDVIPQEEDFYQWLIETNNTYLIRFNGKHFTIDQDNNALMGHNNSSMNIEIGSKEKNVYLIKDVTLDWLYDRIINITKKFYDVIYNIYITNFENFPYENIKHINGKIYSEWKVGKNILDFNNKIKRTEYVVGE